MVYVATPDDNAALRHLMTYFADISMAAKTISCMGLCKLTRMGNSGDDSYTGVAQLLEVDFHYETDTLGSDLESSKTAVV